MSPRSSRAISALAAYDMAAALDDALELLDVLRDVSLQSLAGAPDHVMLDGRSVMSLMRAMCGLSDELGQSVGNSSAPSNISSSVFITSNFLSKLHTCSSWSGCMGK